VIGTRPRPRDSKPPNPPRQIVIDLVNLEKSRRIGNNGSYEGSAGNSAMKILGSNRASCCRSIAAASCERTTSAPPRRSHELTYLSYYGGQRDEGYEREVLTHLPAQYRSYTAAPDTTPFERYLDYARRLCWRAPYAVSKFSAPRLQKLLGEWISQHRFDVAVCDFLSSALNFPENLATPTALFQHNVETVLWKRKAEFEVRWLDRMVSKIEYARWCASSGADASLSSCDRGFRSRSPSAECHGRSLPHQCLFPRAST